MDERQKFVEQWADEVGNILMRGYFADCKDASLTHRQMKNDYDKIQAVLRRIYDSFQPVSKPKADEKPADSKPVAKPEAPATVPPKTLPLPKRA